MIKKAKEYICYQNNKLKKEKTKIEKDKIECKNNKRDASDELEIKKYEKMKICLDNQCVELNKDIFHTLKIDSIIKKREQTLNELKLSIDRFKRICNNESDDSVLILMDKMLKDLDEEMGKILVRELSICNDCLIYG